MCDGWRVLAWNTYFCVKPKIIPNTVCCPNHVINLMNDYSTSEEEVSAKLEKEQELARKTVVIVEMRCLDRPILLDVSS